MQHSSLLQSHSMVNGHLNERRRCPRKITLHQQSAALASAEPPASPFRRTAHAMPTMSLVGHSRRFNRTRNFRSPGERTFLG